MLSAEILILLKKQLYAFGLDKYCLDVHDEH